VKALDKLREKKRRERMEGMGVVSTSIPEVETSTTENMQGSITSEGEIVEETPVEKGREELTYSEAKQIADAVDHEESEDEKLLKQFYIELKEMIKEMVAVRHAKKFQTVWFDALSPIAIDLLNKISAKGLLDSWLMWDMAEMIIEANKIIEEGDYEHFDERFGGFFHDIECPIVGKGVEPESEIQFG